MAKCSSAHPVAGKVYALYSNGDSVAGRDNKIDLLNDQFTNETKTIYKFEGMYCVPS